MATFLPKNITVLIQRMDQGIIWTFKEYWWTTWWSCKLWIAYYGISNLKSKILKDADYSIGLAWRKVMYLKCSHRINIVHIITGIPKSDNANVTYNIATEAGLWHPLYIEGGSTVHSENTVLTDCMLQWRDRNSSIKTRYTISFSHTSCKTEVFCINVLKILITIASHLAVRNTDYCRKMESHHKSNGNFLEPTEFMVKFVPGMKNM
jgi:hypothetical protein